MKILWVKSGGLLPLDSGGNIRSFKIACELARRHDVSLFTYYPNITPDPHPQLAEPFARVEYLPLSVPQRFSVRDMLAYGANMLTLQPYQMRKYCRPRAVRRLRQLLCDGNYDVLLCDFLETATAVPWDLRIPTVIFTHNVEAQIWRRYFLVRRNPLWKMVAWREYQTVALAERRLTALADHVLTVSDEDRRSFLEFLPEDKLTTIPTGVDLDYYRPPESSSPGRSLVFTGSMDWLPNEDAIIYFAAEILPLIRQRIPDVTLSVVGRRPTRKVLALAEANPAVRVTGAVDDIRPYVHEAAVYVVPLRIGGGTRIKIFEAMAMGSAVVSTSIGAEGLPVTHGQDILLADTPETFAIQTIGLLTNLTERDRLGRTARRLVESRYGWPEVTGVLERVLMQVAKPAGTRGNAQGLGGAKKAGGRSPIRVRQSGRTQNC
jgi:glycosyltransferase involved in cell wall biosynthesis